MNIRKISTAAVIPAVLLVGTQLPASANAGDVIRHGACSAASNWKLKASPDNGRIEVEAEVDSNRNGQTWKWRIMHNGSVSARGHAKTTAPSGSFTVRRLVVNAGGTDRLGLRATNLSTGETCSGHLRF